MSILRKAMWPTALIAGMLVMLAAIGTSTAPTAYAAAGDVCPEDDGFVVGISGSDNVLGLQGPFPNFDSFNYAGAALDDPDSQDHNLLLVGQTYLFAVVVEDLTGLIIDVQVDDEEGDADIESFADASNLSTDAPNTVVAGSQNFINLPGSGVDSVDQIDSLALATWNLPSVAPVTNQFVEDLTEVWSYALLDCGDPAVADGLSFITVTCDEAGEFEITAYEDAETDNVVTNDYICYNSPSTVTITATPTTVEAVPAVGNLSHSLVVLTLTDSAGGPTVPGYEIDWTVAGRCLIDGLTETEYVAAAALWAAYSITNPNTGANIEATYNGHGSSLTAASNSQSFNIDGSSAPGYQPKSIGAAILHCEGATPGVASVRAEVDRSPAADIAATTDVTVVGPPAFITMTAAPSKLVCGEKATILVTVTDAINQKVSDHTRVELITNYGGVIGGTGASLTFPGVNAVSPLSSGAAETFGGVATAYLLTSTAHVGAYEVVAAAGGSHLGYYLGGWNLNDEGTQDDEFIQAYGANGYFSTPVVTSQVTVTCTEGAPVVTAPSTGTGTISPPNTGDAGLAAARSSTASLFVIAGAVAFALAGLASFSFARRS